VFRSNLEDAKRELKRVRGLQASLNEQIESLPKDSEESHRLVVCVVELEINMAELEREVMRYQS